MAIMDPIADMLTRIRNAVMVQKQDVIVPFSNPNLGIIDIFRSEGFIKAHKIISNEKSKKSIEISLNYDEQGKSIIKGLKRVSKPGLRVYVKKGEIPIHDILCRNVGVRMRGLRRSCRGFQC